MCLWVCFEGEHETEGAPLSDDLGLASCRQLQAYFSESKFSLEWDSRSHSNQLFLKFK